MPAYLEWLRAHVGHHLIPLVYATALIRDEAGRILFQLPVPHTFAWRVVGGQLRADGDESLAVGYFSREALPPLHPTMRQRVHQALGLEPTSLV